MSKHISAIRAGLVDDGECGSFARMNRLVDFLSIMEWLQTSARIFTSGGFLAKTATALTFDDGNGNGISFNLLLRDVLKNERTSECIRVAARPPTNTCVVIVERGVAGTECRELRLGDIWRIVESHIVSEFFR